MGLESRHSTLVVFALCPPAIPESNRTAGKQTKRKNRKNSLREPAVLKLFGVSALGKSKKVGAGPTVGSEVRVVAPL